MDAGSDLAARGLALLMLTDDEHLSSHPKLSVSSAIDISDCDGANLTAAVLLEHSPARVAFAYASASHRHSLLIN